MMHFFHKCIYRMWLPLQGEIKCTKVQVLVLLALVISMHTVLIMLENLEQYLETLVE